MIGSTGGGHHMSHTPVDKLLADAMTAAQQVRRESRFATMIETWLDNRRHERALDRCAKGQHIAATWRHAKDIAVFSGSVMPLPGMLPSRIIRIYTSTCRHCGIPMSHQLPFGGIT